jgi:hypothetical protein
MKKLKLTKNSRVALLAGAAAGIISILGAGSVFAQYTQVNLTSYVNANLLNDPPYFDNGVLPSGGTTLTVGAVPFGLALDGGVAGTLGIVQSPNSGVVPPPTDTPYSFTFAVPAGLSATALYSLANSAYGEAGYVLGSITVTGTGGETATENLAEDYNIRDYNNGIWENSVSDADVVATDFVGPGGDARLDMQELVLPSSFDGDTIASITFAGTAYGETFGGYPGDAFIAGLTFAGEVSSGVPDGSSTLSLLAIGFGTLAGLRRRLARA